MKKKSSFFYELLQKHLKTIPFLLRYDIFLVTLQWNEKALSVFP